MDKYFGKNKIKTLSGKYSQNFLIMLNNLQQMHLKLLKTLKTYVIIAIAAQDQANHATNKKVILKNLCSIY